MRSRREQNYSCRHGQSRTRARSVRVSTLSGLLIAAAATSHYAEAATPQHAAAVTNREASNHRERVPLDSSVLDDAVAAAEKAGVRVERRTASPDVVDPDSVRERQESISRSYREQANALGSVAEKARNERERHNQRVAESEARYRQASEAYESEKKAYDAAKSDYDARKAAYDAHLKEQITDANPDVALTPGKLVYEQPFEISENRNSLVSVEGIENHPGRANQFDRHNNYNSDSVTHINPVDGSSFTITYKNVAKDKASGRSLDARILVSDVVTSTTNDGEPAIEVFSNYSDNLALYKVTALKQTITFVYSDTGENYANNYYVSFGSLNGQSGDGASRYEFASGTYTAGGDGVIATFLNPESEISPRSQPVHLASHREVPRAFMLPQGSNQSRSIADTDPEIMRRLGVTFLAHNGSSFWVGTSGGSDGRDPDDVGGITATYNHVMLSADTVAPTESLPAPPTPPKPPVREVVPDLDPIVASVEYHELCARGSGTVKTAPGEGKFVLPGQVTHQTVTKRTGFEPLRQFVVGDNIFATEDGRIPVSVDMSSVRVTSDSRDVSGSFRLSQEETEFLGKKVLQIRAEAIDPASLPINTEFALHIAPMALADGKADDLVDAGFGIVNGRLDYTEPHTYHEPSIEPHKHGLVPGTSTKADGRTVTVGDTIEYRLLLDTSQLTDVAEPITRFGMLDDYDERHGRIPASAVRVLKLPADADIAPTAPLDELARHGAEDVTDTFDVTDSGAQGISIMAKIVDGAPRPPLGFKYAISLPYSVSTNSDGEIQNSAWEIVNDHKVQTETVANVVKSIRPHKDIVVSAKNQSSLDGKEIHSGQTFEYRLDSSVRPSHYAGRTVEWSVFDDYDESHDRYDGDFTVLSRNDFVLEDGTVVSAGQDITRFFTQKIDDRSGAVTFTATEDLLKVLNLEKNLEKEQSWSVYARMTRIAAGDVENTFTESYNGAWSASNTVRTRTPEPPAPQPHPKGPEQPPMPSPEPSATPEPPDPPVRPPAGPPDIPEASGPAESSRPSPGEPAIGPRSPGPAASTIAYEPSGKGPTAHTGNTGEDGHDPVLAGGAALGGTLLGYGVYRARHRRIEE
ncbi:MAG: LPXTG cell wall anchor domain-containing protein [Kocuria sp.]|nr:LPXTG cell wall anchor domain-containing protein [Kocuria sp.]